MSTNDFDDTRGGDAANVPDPAVAGAAAAADRDAAAGPDAVAEPGVDPAFDPALAQAILDAQPDVTRRLTIDGAVLFTAWGLAWLVGYLLLWFTGRESADDTAPGWALATFFGLLVSAGVVTAVHIARRSRGVRGVSADSGLLYGLSWTFSFIAVSFIIGGLAQHGLSGPQIAVLSNGVSCLVVGALYMAGAAMTRQRTWFVLGAWIAAVGGFTTALPIAQLYLVMALAGGGGMLAAAALSSVRGRSTSRGGGPRADGGRA
ncbi:hypothetical protein EDD28_1361 [Salana multivorans]|uniref:Uncharacterized protein n=1 Tax=Salana multivorans TaxID=120377 RepID=A0A3N2DAE3_9MICO|nr:hypothetical protein [Salana multivorans]ROR96770.1 hypothetical protein EDD28_1361 [Salana multivorans]